jgi:hypothetical protein
MLINEKSQLLFLHVGGEESFWLNLVEKAAIEGCTVTTNASALMLAFYWGSTLITVVQLQKF